MCSHRIRFRLLSSRKCFHFSVPYASECCWSVGLASEAERLTLHPNMPTSYTVGEKKYVSQVVCSEFIFIIKH